MDTSDDLSNSNMIRNRSIDLSFGVLVAILNAVEMVMILRLKKRRIYETILLSLSITDLLFGLSNAVICIIYLVNVASRDVLQATSTTYFFFVLTSILHLTLMSFDRLWTVLKPIRHRIAVTNKRTKIALIIVWGIALLAAVSLILVHQNTTQFNKRERIQRRQIRFYNNTENINNTLSGRNFTMPTLDGSLVTTRRPKTRTRRTTRTHPPTRNVTRTVFEERIKDGYPQTMKLVLSYIIIVADIIFILCNAGTIYALNREKKVKATNSENMERKVSMVCFCVMLTFILLTSPYAFSMFITEKGEVAVNILLVLNSGVNSIVYFFRNKIIKCFGRKDKQKEMLDTSSSSGAGTPLSERVAMANKKQ